MQRSGEAVSQSRRPISILCTCHVAQSSLSASEENHADVHRSQKDSAGTHLHWAGCCCAPWHCGSATGARAPRALLRLVVPSAAYALKSREDPAARGPGSSPDSHCEYGRLDGALASGLRGPGPPSPAARHKSALLTEPSRLSSRYETERGGYSESASDGRVSAPRIGGRCFRIYCPRSRNPLHPSTWQTPLQ